MMTIFKPFTQVFISKRLFQEICLYTDKSYVGCIRHKPSNDTLITGFGNLDCALNVPLHECESIRICINRTLNKFHCEYCGLFDAPKSNFTIQTGRMCKSYWICKECYVR